MATNLRKMINNKEHSNQSIECEMRDEVVETRTKVANFEYLWMMQGHL